MLRYIGIRLVSLIFVLLAVSLITFVIMHSVQGGPFDVGDRPLPAPTKAAMEKKFGLDKPLWQQYLTYLWNVLHLDFGVPNKYPNETVTSLIARTWPTTLKVGVVTIGFAYPMGLFLGYLAATHQRSTIDYSMTFLATLGIAIPNFVLAIWLILLFGVHWEIFPLRGLDSWKSYVLPVTAYALGPMALVAQYTRSSLVDNLKSDYVRTARAKGLAERQVMSRHVFRNASIPLVTVILPEIPNILTGSIFIEMAFGIPGIGRFFVQSTFNRDYPMIMALVLLVAAVWGLMYLLTDILYVLLDPQDQVGLASTEEQMTAPIESASTPASPEQAARRYLERAEHEQVKSRSNLQLSMRRFFRHRLAVFGLIVTSILLVLAIFAPLIAPFPYDYAKLLDANQFPSREHLFGTDAIGRDYFSRILFGLRTSLMVGFISVFIGCSIGIPLGLIGGLGGKWGDFIVMRIVEVMTAFPGLLFAIFLVSVLGSGVRNVILVIGLTSWLTVCRLTRAQLLTLREQDFVLAARALGASPFSIAVKHLLPLAIAPLVVLITLSIPVAIFIEAGLSFLGIGINEPTPSLGKMVSDGAPYIQLYWYLGLFPTIAIALAMLGFTFLGDGLRDALDPRQ